MIESSCHCGNIKLKIDAPLPENLVSCNCSICSRYGSLMAYFKEKQVEIQISEGPALRYITGDKKLAFVNCPKCGCFSHWEGLPPKESDRIGLNARLFTNVDIQELRVRRFDGAKSWQYLD